MIPADLEPTLINQRAHGKVTLKHTMKTKNITYNHGSLLSELGFRPIPLHTIELRQAQILTNKILHKDMAYNHDCMSEEQATKLTQSIFSTLNSNSILYTNHSGEQDGSSWTPVSDASYDFCLLIEDPDSILLLCIEDQD